MEGTRVQKRNIKKLVITLCASVLLAGCTHTQSSRENPKWEDCEQIYKTVVQYSNENDSTEKYLEIAERSDQLFQQLEENVDAFVMDAYNYQSIDDDGTPLYTMNTLSLSYSLEIAPNGQSIQVSRNYFLFNPIETADGSDLVEQIIYDDMTLNLLVPEKYQEMEEQIIESYRADFFFRKVTATND